jgi:hypothetical protein
VVARVRVTSEVRQDRSGAPEIGGETARQTARHLKAVQPFLVSGSGTKLAVVGSASWKLKRAGCRVGVTIPLWGSIGNSRNWPVDLPGNVPRP